MQFTKWDFPKCRKYLCLTSNEFLLRWSGTGFAECDARWCHSARPRVKRTLHQTHKGSFCSTAVLFLIRRSNEPSQSCRSVPAGRRMQAGCRTTRLMLLNYSVILESNYTKLAFASSTSIPHHTALNCKRCTKHDFLCKVISCLYLAINITFLCYIYLST